MDFLLEQDLMELEETILFSDNNQYDIDKAWMLYLYFLSTNKLKEPYTFISFLEEDSLGLVGRNKNLQKLKNEIKGISGLLQ